MSVKAIVLILYFAVVIALGFLTRRKLKESPSEYFLAGRGLGTFVLICTMAATNFSAFTVFGASGAGYRDGLAFFPIMAFGTGFMAITFWLIGRKVWRLGREHNLVTPAELVSKIYNHSGVSILFALVMVVFTVPYLALQPMAGGMVLKQLFGLNEVWGAMIVTGIILIYVLRGGFKAVAWTDVFQGFLMVSLMLIMLVLVANHHGGLSFSASKMLVRSPDLFARPGGAGTYTIYMWFSFLFLWFFCDPMFPQLFQRFYAAKSERSLSRTMLFYPVICTVVFALPVLLGLLGHLDFPSLSVEASDNIVPLLATKVGGDIMGTLLLAAGLAALMSTMDSQLLTLSSIFTRDLLPVVSKRQEYSALAGRLFVIGLAIAGLIMAVTIDKSILELGIMAFTGLAVLFPAVLFGLYLKNPRPVAGIASIIVGETLVVLYIFTELPAFGFLPVVPVIVATLITYLFVHLITGPVGWPKIQPRGYWYAAGFGLIFLLAMDFWRWGEVGSLWLGWPLWAWYFVALSAMQTVLMIFWVRKHNDDDI